MGKQSDSPSSADPQFYRPGSAPLSPKEIGIWRLPELWLAVSGIITGAAIAWMLIKLL